MNRTDAGFFSLVVAALLLLLITGIACDQYRARRMGGTQTIDLLPGEKLVTASWKDTELWYLTRERRDGERVERSILRQSSLFGLSGAVIFVEHE